MTNFRIDKIHVKYFLQILHIKNRRPDPSVRGGHVHFNLHRDQCLSDWQTVWDGCLPEWYKAANFFNLIIECLKVEILGIFSKKFDKFLAVEVSKLVILLFFFNDEFFNLIFCLYYVLLTVLCSLDLLWCSKITFYLSKQSIDRSNHILKTMCKAAIKIHELSFSKENIDFDILDFFVIFSWFFIPLLPLHMIFKIWFDLSTHCFEK